MHDSIGIFLINNDVRAIKVSYEPNQKHTEHALVKTFDKDINVGDYVVVATDTRYKMTVCKVEEIDVDIDFDSDKEIKWIISKLNTAYHETLLAQERGAIKAIRAAELRKKRDDMRQALFKDHAETLRSLPIAHS